MSRAELHAVIPYLLEAVYTIGAVAAVAGVVALLAWGLPRLRMARQVDRNQARSALEGASRSLPWASRAQGEEPLLHLDREGYRGRVEYRSGTRPATDATYHLGCTSGDWLQVSPESVGRGMAKHFGFKDLEIGDPKFDADHEITGSSLEFARRLLDEDKRMMLRALGMRFDFLLRVTPQTLLLRAERHLYEPADIEALVGAATYLVGALGLPERRGVEMVEVQSARLSDGTCQICGSALAQGKVVECAKCRTPHHQDCWEFNGVCATFACGSRETA